MKSRLNRHLSDQEMDLLISPVSEGSPGRETELESEINKHLQACAFCCERVKQLESAQKKLAQMKLHSHLASGTDCPPPSAWLLVAAGGLEQSQAFTYSKHASGCDRCGPRLRQALRDVQQEPTEDELESYSQSVLSSPQWQAQMADKLAMMRARRSASRRSFRLTLAWAGAVASFAIVGIVWFKFVRSPDPNQLLAQAYSQQRTIEMRFRGATYAPLRLRRGGGTPGYSPSQLDRPKPLIEAEAEIVRGLSHEPENASWLQSKGKTDLLAWNYDSAIKSFRRALELRPNSPDLMTDLAMAYFERAEASHQPLDYGPALDYLGQALQQSPNDPVALFNHAIVAGRLHLYNQAISDLEKLLINEPTGGWASEARSRLNELRRERDHGNEPHSFLRTPAAFLDLMQGNSAVAKSYLSQHADELLETALVSWIPTALGKTPEAAVARSALMLAAHWLAANCDDPWLYDLVANDLEEKKALLALSQAVAANLAGNPLAADRLARRSALLFESSHNAAGNLRARWEEIYSAQRQVDGQRCLNLAQALSQDLKSHPYHWIEAQFWIEDSICTGMQGLFDRAVNSIEHGIAVARVARYGTLSLRALGIKAAMENTLGNTSAAWSENLTGLELFWAGTYPPQRAYQFYADLAFVAQRQNLWNLAAAFAREAVWAIERTPNRSTEAMAWHRLGTLAQRAALTDEAVWSFQQASRIFTSLPLDDAVRRYRLDCWINIAFLQASTNDVNVPLHQLENLKDEVLGVSDINVVLRYHYTVGMLSLRAGKLEAAETSLRNALKVSQNASGTLKNDRDRNAWEGETESIYRGLVEVLLESHRRDEAFHLWRSRFTFRGFQRANKQEYRPHSGELLITYVQLSKGVVLWTAGERGITSEFLSTPPALLEQQVRQFMAECADPESPLESVRHNGRELYQLLLQPIAARVQENSRLLIETDGALDEVPFSALLAPSGEALGKKYEIVMLVGGPAVDTWDWRSHSLGAGETALAVGDASIPPELQSNFPALPDSGVEAREVAGLFRHNVLLTGNQATLSAVMRGLPSAGLFHFAGHATSGADGDALVLASDQSGLLLGPKQLQLLRLHQSHLVVLAACSTGVQNPEKRFATLGLVRRFIQAGSHQVVATRWDIDSVAASSFMHQFYSALLASGSAPAALRAAIEKTDTSAVHPHFWAAFSLYASN